MNRRDFLKNTLWMGAATLTGEATAKGAYDHYRDWELRQVEVPSTNATETVRLHYDLTKPLHGPWLTNPAYGEMTVAFVSREACGAAVEYREKGTEAWTRQWLTTYGMIDYTRRIHIFHLKGLKPATEYEYRFAVCSSRYLTAYFDVVVGRETWSFKTLDPKGEKTKVFVSADIHGSLRLWMDYLYGRTGAADADMYVFLGDNVEDSMSQPEFYITSGFLDEISRLWGPTKPTMFVRGNHDSWGLHAADGWAEWFARPDAKGYYTIRRGNALFICFDMPQEYYFKHAGQEVALQYVAEEREWLKALIASDEWKTATWHIGCCHYGTRTTPSDGMFKRFRDTFGDLLNDPAVGFDLMLCGHEHYYARCLAHTAGYYHNPRKDRPNTKPRVFKEATDQWNFAEVCGAQAEASILEIDGRKLTFTSHDYSEENLEPLDTFTLTK